MPSYLFTVLIASSFPKRDRRLLMRPEHYVRLPRHTQPEGKRKMRHFVVCLVCLAALSGCGGGGGSDLASLAPTALSATSASPVTRGNWFTCTCVYLDPNGTADLRDCKLGITPTDNRVCFKYVRSENRLYAYNSVSGTWGPSGGVAPGNGTYLESTDATLDCANTTVSVDGNKVTVGFTIRFKQTMPQGVFGLATACTDLEGHTSSGTWTTFGGIVVN